MTKQIEAPVCENIEKTVAIIRDSKFVNIVLPKTCMADRHQSKVCLVAQRQKSLVYFSGGEKLTRSLFRVSLGIFT